MKQILLQIFIILPLFLSSAQAASGEASRLKGVMEASIEAVYGESSADLSLAEKQAKVREVLESEYDLNIVIRRSIGRNWRLMTAQEQEEVLELVKQLIVKTYVKYLDGKARPEVEVGEVLEITDKRMEIPSTVKIDDLTVNIVYRLGKMPSGWEVYDIVAEDISVVSNFREQIDDHFRKGNGRELIDKLNELLSKDGLDEELQLK